MELKGHFAVHQSPDEVYRFLVDPRRFGRALPDLQSLEVIDAKSFKAVFRVGISFIKGPMQVQFELQESKDSKMARYKIKGTGLGSFVELQAGFELHEKDDGTEVSWEGVAQIGGRLAAAAGGLLQPVAEKNVTTFIEALKREMERTP